MTKSKITTASPYQVKWYMLVKSNGRPFPKRIIKGLSLANFGDVILTHSKEHAAILASRLTAKDNVASSVITDKQFGLISINRDVMITRNRITATNGNNKIYIPLTLKQMGNPWHKSI